MLEVDSGMTSLVIRNSVLSAKSKEVSMNKLSLTWIMNQFVLRLLLERRKEGWEGRGGEWKV